jgi:DNA modification methylase
VDDVAEFAASWVPQAIENVARDGYAYIFVGSYADELEAYLGVLADTDFYVQPLVWNYRNTLGRSPDDRYKRDWQAVLYCRGPDAGDLNAPKTSELRSVQEVNAPGMVGDDTERHHEWQKPRQLVEQYIRHSTEKGDLVIDPFAGSGEVLLAAADVGRQATGCDIDPDAVATAESRGCERP